MSQEQTLPLQDSQFGGEDGPENDPRVNFISRHALQQSPVYALQTFISFNPQSSLAGRYPLSL